MGENDPCIGIINAKRIETSIPAERPERSFLECYSFAETIGCSDRSGPDLDRLELIQLSPQCLQADVDLEDAVGADRTNTLRKFLMHLQQIWLVK